MEGLENKLQNCNGFFLSLKEFWLKVSGQFWVVEIQMLIFLFFFSLFQSKTE